MNIFRHYHHVFNEIIEKLKSDGVIIAAENAASFTVEPPKEESHGDLSCNAAMLYAKSSGKKPRDLAIAILEALGEREDIVKAEIAGPGFINLFLHEKIWREAVKAAIAQPETYGQSVVGAGLSVNVEYVSANPTGPLHIGHLRGAAYGDALAELLKFCGYAVTKEYYVNDAGGQIGILSRSAYLRYREASGEEIGDIPEGLYPGEYLIEVGQSLFQKYGDDLKNKPEAEREKIVREFSVHAMLTEIKADLARIRIQHDVFTSEKTLIESGKIESCLKALEEKGLIYIGALEAPKGKPDEDWESRPQTLFKSSAYGDDTDRPIRKSDGSVTYFLSDIAYHHDKFERGADLCVDVWGADHGGYVKRVSASIEALRGKQAKFEVKLCQMVRLMKNNEPYKMSKRSGNFISLREIVNEVGADAARFITLTRKNDAPLDFDIEKAKEQSRDNPVFYVQYAHARIYSVFQNAETELGEVYGFNAITTKESDLCELTDEHEKALVRKIAQYPRMIEQAATATEPHRIAFYLQELAGLFHSYWNAGKENFALRFINCDNLPVTTDRLKLIRACGIVIASGLKRLGASAPNRM